MTTKALGENGFRWFLGKVVEREKDPQKLGRLKVRIFGLHDDEGRIPDDKLPWATPLTPPYSAASNQVGISPLGTVVGSIVFGFFLDGNEAQLPVILGCLAGIPDDDVTRHDVAKLAREENDLLDQKNNSKIVGTLVTEPGSAYKAKYPFNKVYRTERGHVVEIDDTEGEERLHLYHKAGTFVEIDKDGNRVDKIVGDNYTVVAKNNNVLVEGDCIVDIKGKSIVRIEKTSNILVIGDCVIESKGEMFFKSDKKITMDAPEIHLNPNRIGTVIGGSGGTSTISAPTAQGKAQFAGFVQPNITRSRYGG